MKLQFILFSPWLLKSPGDLVNALSLEFGFGVWDMGFRA